MGFKPRHKKVPCKECGAKGQVRRHWAAGGGRIGYRCWMEPCPSCRRRAIAIESLEGLDRVKFALENIKGSHAIDEKYRYEIEGETWNSSLKRYEYSTSTETQATPPSASTTSSTSRRRSNRRMSPKKTRRG